jgi:hypothetical protein
MIDVVVSKKTLTVGKETPAAAAGADGRCDGNENSIDSSKNTPTIGILNR